MTRLLLITDAVAIALMASELARAREKQEDNLLRRMLMPTQALLRLRDRHRVDAIQADRDLAVRGGVPWPVPRRWFRYAERARYDAEEGWHL